MDKHAVKAIKGDETVSHFPRKFSRIAWYFVARGGEISFEEIDRRRFLIFIYWRFSVQFVTQKASLLSLKAMVSYISRTRDFWPKT